MNNDHSSSEKAARYWRVIAFVLLGIFIVNYFFSIEFAITPQFVFALHKKTHVVQEVNIEEAVLPSEGILLPIRWGSFGKQMVEAGVIDADQFEELYANQGGLGGEARALLYEENNNMIVISRENAHTLLNLLWAFGLSNKNPILEEGPMIDPRYGGDAGNFASTGGWTLAVGDAMDHYSAHSFAVLTEEQQRLVERVSQNIYRPCCGNSVYFPDCNHGMAMLGLLELMAAESVSEEEMYAVALQVNSYWFPDTYLTIATYFQMRGVSWDEVDAKEVLGSAYSSAQGYQKILLEVGPPESRGGESCGV
ncbi:MAG: hypothetical protein Q8O83_03805 [bacterium]|nr:hypothetical protein [bacterium]